MQLAPCGNSVPAEHGRQPVIAFALRPPVHVVDAAEI